VGFNCVQLYSLQFYMEAGQTGTTSSEGLAYHSAKYLRGNGSYNTG